MIKRFLYPFAFYKALKLDEAGEYKKAIKILNKYSDYINKNKFKFVDYYILLAELYAKEYEINKAKDLFKKARDLLDTDNSYFNVDEKEFLKKYIYKWLSYIYKLLNDKQYLAYKQKAHNINKLNIDNVRRALKINFKIK